MSLDLRLPDAVKQLEGAIFGFKRDISTTEAALKSATQTADLQVKAAKISGMTPDDITQVYKYGATPSRLSGVSEQTLLAFGGIAKKANMGGQESGTAFRALMSAAQAPTQKAREAMLANGLNYKNY
ncbi:MAG TPA: phage tail tape measure protein [Nitrobacter sp.]|nr:phage tail tape measure protein [Nitrobacter sp.]